MMAESLSNMFEHEHTPPDFHIHSPCQVNPKWRVVEGTEEVHAAGEILEPHFFPHECSGASIRGSLHFMNGTGLKIGTTPFTTQQIEPLSLQVQDFKLVSFALYHGH